MRSFRLFTAMLLAGGLMAGPAFARHHHHVATAAPAAAQNAPNAQNGTAANANNNPNLASADALLQNASGVIQQMQSDSNLNNLLHAAKGVFIIPNSGNASSNGASAANSGVLLSENKDRWSDPVFFTAGSAKQGANNGQVVLLIMSNRAMNEFRNGGFSLNGKARLNVVNYSGGANTQPASLQRSDVIVWQGASNGNNTMPVLTNVRSNPAYDKAIYGTGSMHRIMAGRAPLTNQLAVNLATQLPAGQPDNQLGTQQTGTRAG